MSGVALEAVGLHKRFGKISAVNGVDLHVEEGVIYGFLGPNGAGKTTTIRMALGLVAPNQGHVEIFGHDVRRHFKAAIRNVGALVEGPAFYPYMSARENLSLFGSISGKLESGRVEEVLGQVGLARRAGQKVRGFSQGMRQRLGIALAMLERPRLLVLDEPTNGLDPQGTREIRELIRRERDERGTTVLVSSHLLGEMELVCDRVAILFRGVVLQEGPLKDVIGGESDRVAIEVDEADDARAALLLEGMGHAPERVRLGQLEFQIGSGDLAQVNRSLVEAGVSVQALSRRRRSLEEAFVSLTGTGMEIL